MFHESMTRFGNEVRNFEMMDESRANETSFYLPAPENVGVYWQAS